MIFLRDTTKQLLYKQAKNIVLTNQSLTKKMIKYYIDNKDYKKRQGLKDIVFIIIAIVVGVTLGLVAGYFISFSENGIQEILFSKGKYVIFILGTPLLLFFLYFIQSKIKAYFGWLNKEDTYYILSENVYKIVVSRQHLKGKD